MDFKLSSYKNTLNEALKLGYEFVNFKNAISTKTKLKILIRHDIDFSIDQALKIAEIESSLNIFTTYFIRMHSKFYNALSEDSKKKINYIENLGHQIGLHFEEDFYEKTDIYLAMKFEKNLLDSFLNRKISSIAPHEPSRTKRFTYDETKLNKIKITHQAYDENLLKNFTYISDSSASFRDGTIEEHVFIRKTPYLYILTHPIWWYEKTPIETY